MPVWDLATRENWELLLQDRRIAQRVSDPNLAPYLYKYKPINPIYATPNSTTLLIGAYSDSARPTWFLGATASQYLYVSPSFDSQLIGGVQSSDSKKIGLRRLTLVKFDDYDISPYTLQLDIPYWLEDIYIEVWEYTGYIEPGYQEVLDRLDSIEMKIDAMETQGA